VGLEEVAGGEVIELTAVVALYALNGDTELGTDVSKKMVRAEKVSSLRRKGKVHK
jgi:hypothetical protein